MKSADGEPLHTTPGGNTVPQYAGGKVRGVLVRPGGAETPLVSGYVGPSSGVRGIPRMNGNIKSHVESHAAVLTRQEGLTEATLYINKAPCPTIDPRSLGCQEALPHMLPEGARLRVLGPEGFDHTYQGLADPPDVNITGIAP